MERGDVVTELCERKRFLKSSANASSILTDHLSPFTYLSCLGPMKDEDKSLELGAVSSVVEHYLDTVGVTGSNPVSRTISRLPHNWLRQFRRRGVVAKKGKVAFTKSAEMSEGLFAGLIN